MGFENESKINRLGVESFCQSTDVNDRIEEGGRLIGSREDLIEQDIALVFDSKVDVAEFFGADLPWCTTPIKGEELARLRLSSSDHLAIGHTECGHRV